MSGHVIEDILIKFMTPKLRKESTYPPQKGKRYQKILL